MEGEEGDWEERKELENKVPLHYDLNKHFPDRIKKPLAFDEIEE